jgi:hypothetical protein
MTVMWSIETTNLPTVPFMLVSHHRRKCLMSSLTPKVKMMKYIPLSLRVRRPIKRARIKLTVPPEAITTGRGNACPSTAET